MRKSPDGSSCSRSHPSVEEGLADVGLADVGLAMVQLIAPDWDEAAEWLFVYGGPLRTSHAFVLAVAKRLIDLKFSHSEIQRALIILFGAPLLSKMLGSKVKIEA